jgi:uncharacterized protein YjbI with pentapeptide repeats
MPDAELRADCARCVGLCCVAPAFAASADFAVDKPAGRACQHLQEDFRCATHDRLRPAGFPGCSAYDCFGAGQQITQVTFGGRDWRRTPKLAAPMFAAFTVMRQLHELLWYLHEARTQATTRPLADDLARACDATAALTRRAPDALLTTDVAAHRQNVNAVLLEVSACVRAGVRGGEVDYRGADLVGRDLRGRDLRAASFRGALLLGADLRAADLRQADLLGADLRGADLGGADLTGAIFVTQSQLEAATGDQDTRLPSSRTRPAHWRRR